MASGPLWLRKEAELVGALMTDIHKENVEKNKVHRKPHKAACRLFQKLCLLYGKHNGAEEAAVLEEFSKLSRSERRKPKELMQAMRKALKRRPFRTGPKIKKNGPASCPPPRPDNKRNGGRT